MADPITAVLQTEWQSISSAYSEFGQYRTLHNAIKLMGKTDRLQGMLDMLRVCGAETAFQQNLTQQMATQILLIRNTVINSGLIT